MVPSHSSIEEILDMLCAGQWVSAAAADSPEVSDMLTRCADTCFDINNMRPSRKEERRQVFQNLLGKFGKNSVIHSPFRCDFGFNIQIGDHFVGNFNLSILDEAEVTIGDHVMIGPNCSLITITHALQEDHRQEGLDGGTPHKDRGPCLDCRQCSHPARCGDRRGCCHRCRECGDQIHPAPNARGR